MVWPKRYGSPAGTGHRYRCAFQLTWIPTTRCGQSYSSPASSPWCPRTPGTSAAAGAWACAARADRPVLLADSVGRLGAASTVLIDACYAADLATELRDHAQPGSLLVGLNTVPGSSQETRGRDSVTALGAVIRELCYPHAADLSSGAVRRPSRASTPRSTPGISPNADAALPTRRPSARSLACTSAELRPEAASGFPQIARGLTVQAAGALAAGKCSRRNTRVRACARADDRSARGPASRRDRCRRHPCSAAATC